MKSRVIIVAIIVCTVVAILFKVGNKNDIVVQFKEAVETKDIEKLVPLFDVEKTEKIDEIGLNHFLQYISADDTRLEQTISSLQAQVDDGIKDTTAVVQLNIDEKRYGVIPTYHLSLQESELQIIDFDLVHIKVRADSAILEQGHKNKLVYGPVFPGEYNVEIEFDNELGTFLVQEEITVWNEEKVKIRIDEEEVVARDGKLMESLFTLGGIFALQMEQLAVDGLEEDINFHIADKFYRELVRVSENQEIKNDLIFKEAIIDEDSYEMILIDDRWYSEVRMIVTYDQEDHDDKPVYLLFMFDFLFNPLTEEWFISDISLRDADLSLLDLWDSDIKLTPEDLKLDGQIDLVL